MKLITLEGSNSDLLYMQYQLSGGLAGSNIGGLKKSFKKAKKKVSHTVKDKTSDLIEKAKDKAQAESLQLLEKAKAKAKAELEKNLTKYKTKLKSYADIDMIVQTQLRVGSMYANEFINNLPIVGTVNRGLTTVIGTSPTEYVVNKAGNKVYAYTKETLKEQTGKLISKYIPKVNDADIPNMQTGVFDEYMNDNPDFNTFGKSKAQLSVMSPDEMYKLINDYIKTTPAGELLIKCGDDVLPDVAKMYYYTAGQSGYNLYSKYLYEQMVRVQKQNDEIRQNPEKAETIIVSSLPDDANINL